MLYKRHFNYEIYWSGTYYMFDYLQDARKFLRNKTRWIIHKCWYNGSQLIKYEWFEECR